MPRSVLLARGADGHPVIVPLDEAGAPLGDGPPESVEPADLPDRVAEVEANHAPRWVLPDTPARYDALLGAGVRIGRCHDLRLAHAILANSELVADTAPLRAADGWSVPLHPAAGTAPAGVSGATLFDLDSAPAGGVPDDAGEALAELARQSAAIDGSADPSRLRLLVAAESAGALVAAEMRAAGIPWDVAEHDRILTDELGPRPSPGQAPARMAEVGAEVRAALGDPLVPLDSPPRLLRALHRAGIDVASTSKRELTGIEHPAIDPLLRYKAMSRLLTANGWAWIDDWVHEGRYRPVYVPGGVVTGRWASSGGGALQIPRRLRPAVCADPGWVLVAADVSQLEPRVLAAMSGDAAMAQAGAGRDLYAGIVEEGVVATRQEAKVGVLGALYGGTSGDAGRVVARLRSTFPAAMALVDGAAAAGERGGTVTTLLGRSSPPPPPEWSAFQASAHGTDAAPGEGERARRIARDRGRFTRNFVVQGTAAEWALSWMALLRARLAALPEAAAEHAATASGPVFSRRAHLVHFLHDEVLVHAPAEQADAAADAIRAAAEAAGRLLFPGSEVDFPLELTVSERGTAK